MTFSVDWFSAHIPTWEEKVLPRLPDMPQYLEIGSYEGRSMAWMLQKNHGMIGTSIDPHSDGSWETFISNMREFGNRIKIIREMSQTALFPLSFHYNCIYIDGSHYAYDVLMDSTLAWPKLKTGGVFIWDDYGWLVEDDPIKGPKHAVDAFLTCYRTQYKVLHIGYQFIVEKL